MQQQACGVKQTTLHVLSGGRTELPLEDGERFEWVHREPDQEFFELYVLATSRDVPKPTVPTF